MHKNIQEIPLSEIIKDLTDSKLDVSVCRNALNAGITMYSGGTVQKRLDVNERIIIKINDELKRRGLNVHTS